MSEQLHVDPFEPGDMGRTPPNVYAIKFVHKLLGQAGGRRTQVRCFSSKAEFDRWAERVGTNWNAIMNDGCYGSDGVQYTVEASLWTGAVTWEQTGWQDSAGTWKPQGEAVLKNARSKGKPRARKGEQA